jgi:hypothetical protein
MQYLLLIYGNEKKWSTMPQKDQEAVFGQYMEFTKGIVKSGQYRGGEALQPTQTATTVRVTGGKVVKSDGPYAETKEQLGGYYLIEAKDLDEACSVAAKIPDVHYGGAIEIRPIMPTPKVE